MSKGLSVSVVIPTLNGLLKSDIVLYSLERQSYLVNIVEVIIVDDASNDPEKKVRYELIQDRFSRLNVVVLFHERNTGPAGARNTGVKKAKGDVIFFTDDDCELPSNCIEEHLKIYAAHPSVSSVGGWYKPYDNDIRDSLYQTYMMIHDRSAYGNLLYYPSASRLPEESKFPAINTANLSVRRHVFSQVQFDEGFIAPGYEDLFFSESIRRAGYTMYYFPLFIFHRKKLNLRGFIRLAMNRGMGRYVYYGKHGVLDSQAFDAVLRKRDLIRRLSLTNSQIRKRKWRLFVLVYAWYFLGSSSVMKGYYERAYVRRMGYYPKFIS